MVQGAGPEIAPRLVRQVVRSSRRSAARGVRIPSPQLYSEPKKWAVEHLHALWEEVREPLDPDEVGVWAATHGWAPKLAKTLREITEGVRNGKRFMGVGRAIQRDRERERKMVEHWRQQLTEST